MRKKTQINRALRILEVEPGSSTDQILAAYRDLVKVWHPDRFQSGTRVAQKAEEKLKTINWAHEVLLEGRKFGGKSPLDEKTSGQCNHRASPKPDCGVRSTEFEGDHADQTGSDTHRPSRGRFFALGGFCLALCVAAIFYTLAKEADGESSRGIEKKRTSSGTSTSHNRSSQAFSDETELLEKEHPLAFPSPTLDTTGFRPPSENPSESSRRATIPRFSDYPAPAFYNGPPASVKEKMWKDPVPEPISRAMEESPVYAGEFVRVFWPCGTAGCVIEKFINKRTGVVVEKGFMAYNAWLGSDENGDSVEERVGEWITEIRIDSTLLVTLYVVENQDLQFTYFENYYAVKGGQLDLVKTIEVESGWTIKGGE